MEQAPEFFFLDETCSKVFFGLLNSEGSAYSVDVVDFKEVDSVPKHTQFDRTQNSVLVKDSNVYFDGNNLLAVYKNHQNVLEANSIGQASFKREFTEKASASYSDVKEFVLINTDTIGVILQVNDQEFSFEILPLDQSKRTYAGCAKEISFIDFSYPLIFMLKGCTELLIYRELNSQA